MVDPYAFTVAATVSIAAEADRVYDSVRDITRFGDWSPECTGGEWLGHARGIGTRFLGHNEAAGRTWTTECEVIVADRPHRFSWHVLTNTSPRTSIWTFDIEDRGTACLVTESFEMLATPRPFRAALEARPAEARAVALDARKRQLERGIRATLAALKAELETTS
jgi:hypothetical protein